jgi:hypothetical protein
MKQRKQQRSLGRARLLRNWLLNRSNDCNNSLPASAASGQAVAGAPDLAKKS